MSNSSTLSTSFKSTSSEVPKSAPTSTSSGSSGQGHHRFRGDVAPFSPSGQSPHMYSQQVHTPPLTQGMQYQQQPQLYMQQPQFVYNGQMMPYYPMMGYPEYAYSGYYFPVPNPYTQQPYMNANMDTNMNMGMNMGMNTGMNTGMSTGMNNGYVPRKKHNKNHHNYHNGVKNNLWSSNSATSGDATPAAEPTKKGGKSIEHPSTSDIPESLKSDSSEHNGESKQITNEKAIVEEAKEEMKGAEPNKEKISGTVTEPIVEQKEQLASKKHILPVMFNTSMDEFGSDKKNAATRDLAVLTQKTSRLNIFVAESQENVVINLHASARVVDHTANNTYIKHLYPASTQGAKTYDNDHNDSASAQIPTSNWASFLQTTAKRPAKKGQLPKSLQPDNAVAATPVESSTPTTPATSMPQHLGLLAMRMLFDPDFRLEQCDSFAIKPRGLTNTGNICYMNAVLQCLIFCDPFNKVLKYIQEQAVGSLGDVSPTPLIDAAIDFMSDFNNIPPPTKPNSSIVNSDGIVIGRPLSPEGLYMRLIENTKFQHLKWGQQEDAEEFLGYLLDGLHEEFVKAEATVTNSQMEKYYHDFSRHLDSSLSSELKTRMKEAMRLVSSSERKHVELKEVENDDDQSNGWSEVGSRKRISKKRIVEVEPTPITQIFGGQFRSVLTVPKAKESQSITVDPFRCILVDISGSTVETIEDALWKFNEAEKLPYKIDDTQEVIARKQTFIDHLPKVLILQLKRFSYQHDQNELSEKQENNEDGDSVRALGVIEKVMKNIKYGLDLTIPAECLSAAVRNTQKRDYRLIGAIYHHGRNVEGGHYTCDVRSSQDKWLRIDDTAVEVVEANSVIEKPDSSDKSAYILMYERK